MDFAPIKKLQGTAAELLVASKLVSRGFSVSWPVGDSAPYDLIADSRGKVSRVQIKSCCKKRSGTYHVGFRFGIDGKRIKYTDKEVDFFVVVISYSNGPGFYIIPINELKSSQARFWAPGEHHYNTPRWRLCAYEEFRDRWELLR